MHAPAWFAVAAAAALAGALPLRAAPELVGVLSSAQLELFALHDDAGPGPVRWLQRGQQFAGYTLGDYAPATETLVLRKADATLRLRLREARIQPLAADAEAMRQTAAAAVAQRDGWSGDLRWQGPHLFKGNWLIVARRDAAPAAGSGGEARIETRVLIFNAEGKLQEYLTP